MEVQHIKVVDPTDIVATAIQEVNTGETAEIAVGEEVRTITVTDNIPFGHKIAITDIEKGDTIFKYGKSIGNATENIEKGGWVHVHNVESNYGRGDLVSENKDPTTTGE
jgi:altronate dehydratase small subunit